MRTLIVVNHPSPDSLTRAAHQRVLDGLKRAGDDVRVLDLDAEQFDPRVTEAEKLQHTEHASSTPDLAHHVEALQWAQRLVLVYPTWFGGFPARLKGWFDRAWVMDVAFHLPEGTGRVRAGLKNIKRLEIVTTHGNSRLANFAQGNPGKLTVWRSLRVLCHPLCRRRYTPIYGLDTAEPDRITAWLDHVEELYAG